MDHAKAFENYKVSAEQETKKIISNQEVKMELMCKELY